MRNLSPRSLDALGIALLVLAALSALALWFDAGGLFGRLLEVGVKASFGPVGHAVPVVLGYWAVLLFRSTSREDRGRMLVGLAIFSFGVLGITSV
ncbi:MAG TPA: cell division protein FtsK, partial [Actinomycetota bacterium]|nr:cell division protein FtsK [Actinomycetota bacterium]